METNRRLGYRSFRVAAFGKKIVMDFFLFSVFALASVNVYYVKKAREIASPGKW